MVTTSSRDDWQVVVVVPARDEEQLIDRCLNALGDAISRLTSVRPGVDVDVVLVLDRCIDGTESKASTRRWVRLCRADVGNVGRARALGIEAATAGLPPSRRTWIACTDADSAVPRDWLVDLLDLADTGIDMVVGNVRVDLDELPPTVRQSVGVGLMPDGHDRIYGANLSFRRDAYDPVGGFRPLSVHEDVTLVRAFRAAGHRVHASGSLTVLTSARLDGRAPAGFAGYLRDLLPTVRLSPHISTTSALALHPSPDRG